MRKPDFFTVKHNAGPILLIGPLGKGNGTGCRRLAGIAEIPAGTAAGQHGHRKEDKTEEMPE